MNKVLLDPSQPAPRFDARVAEEKDNYEITQYKPQQENIPENRSLQVNRPEYEQDKSGSSAGQAQERASEDGAAARENSKAQAGRLQEVVPDGEADAASSKKGKEMTEEEKEAERKRKKEEAVNNLSEFLFKNNVRIR